MAGRERNAVYDWLRLIGTVLVVVGHSSYISMHTKLGGVDYVLPGDVNPVYYSLFFRLFRMSSGWVYGFHMPLFFMLSGAVLALNGERDFDSFAASKVRRLAVSYFACGIFFMLPVKYLGNFYSAENFAEAVRSFLNGGESGHLWFLAALFWCMVIFSGLRRIFRRLGVRSVYLSIFAGGGG